MSKAFAKKPGLFLTVLILAVIALLVTSFSLGVARYRAERGGTADVSIAKWAPQVTISYALPSKTFDIGLADSTYQQANAVIVTNDSEVRLEAWLYLRDGDYTGPDIPGASLVFASATGSGSGSGNTCDLQPGEEATFHLNIAYDGSNPSAEAAYPNAEVWAHCVQVD